MSEYESGRTTSRGYSLILKKVKKPTKAQIKETERLNKIFEESSTDKALLTFGRRGEIKKGTPAWRRYQRLEKSGKYK